ncbi:winged helix-turn-helix domain-containing protein [Ferrimonas pelagia]|uniref:winged helix-turn-helix domain-containing protein n=1 Tax=Ferrimonas pelagia TaxID=1177826 RepID=UPI0031EC5B08
MAIEPKVFDVLRYLCLQHERYVSLQELHDEVWQGRVVSDAAVRRAISKLRALLGDDPKDPTLIKSVSKRGYRITCDRVDVPEQYRDAETPDTVSANAKLAMAGDGRVSSPWARWSIASGMVLLVVVAMTFGLLRQYRMSPDTLLSHELVFADSELLSDMPGEKSAIAVSHDGSMLAFTAEMDQFLGAQLFLMQLDSRRVLQLSESAGNVLDLAFSADDQFIYYSVNATNGSSGGQLNRVATSMDGKPELLLEGWFALGKMDLLPQGRGIVFVAIREKNSPIRLYEYDAITGNVNSFYGRSDRHTSDILAKLSPAQDKYAVLSRSGFNNVWSLNVIEAASKSLLSQAILESPVYSMEWVSDTELLVLDRQAIYRVDIDSGSINHLFKKAFHWVTDFYVERGEDLYYLRQQGNDFSFFEVSTLEANTGRFVDTPEGEVWQVLYGGTNNAYWCLRLSGSTYELSAYDYDTEQVYLKVNRKIELLSGSPEGESVLMLLGGRLALLSKSSSQVVYLSDSHELVGHHANFINDGKQIAYGVNSDGEWVLKVYDLAEREVVFTRAEVKAARSYLERWILLSADDVFFAADSLDSESLKKLSIQPDVSEINTRWFIWGNRLFWSEYDISGARVYSHVLGEDGVHEYTKEGQRISGRFDVSDDGERLLLRHWKMSDSEIRRLRLPEVTRE